MTSAGPHGSSPQGAGPSVRVVSSHSSLYGPSSRPPGSRSRHNAKSQGLYVWVVMALLVASTTLALYDLYLLMSIVSTGA